ncbi:MAG: hypothetical protein BWX77_00231 [Bacteroidetes bacterium ADurb.Bin090]|nr:MAG: hypothetical protein BWX77_00231 [Bacteroidetes bacterium ADurb.Bin090]
MHIGILLRQDGTLTVFPMIEFVTESLVGGQGDFGTFVEGISLRTQRYAAGCGRRNGCVQRIFVHFDQFARNPACNGDVIEADLLVVSQAVYVNLEYKSILRSRQTFQGIIVHRKEGVYVVAVGF